MISISAAEGYALWADTWDETPSPIVAVEERALRPWLERLAPRRAVDVGCGTGRWTAALRAIGVDASASMLAIAAGKEGLRGRLAAASAEALPIRSGCADLVVCTLTFGHIRRQAAAMREFERILQPGGTLIVTDFHPRAAAQGWRRTFRRDGETYELENHPFTTAQMQTAAGGLALRESIDAKIGEPERHIFERAGKPELFAAACQFRGAADAVVARMTSALDLSGHVILPGLINAHDHLEFNLFPRLGRGGYPNATAWALDIHHPDRSPIREHLRVPKPVRLWWGALKNLLSGVTTVGHHNPFEASVFTADFPVRVVRRFSWAHSLAFEPELAARFRRAPAANPFVVHCGEGTDAAARGEFEALDSLGALDGRTVLVHGVALTPASLALVRRRGASLIWCPTSNLKMLGRTVSRRVLRSELSIALGTDSALSAAVDLLDELAVAGRYVARSELFDMVTTEPARMLRLSRSRRDWIAVRSDARTPIDALLEGTLAVVVSRGRIRLISPELARQLPARERRRFKPLAVEGRPPVLVAADVPSLYRAAARHLGAELRLAGKRVLV